MFERFTDRARRATTLAQDEARNLGHANVYDADLLLGLIVEDGGVAARVLKMLGVTYDVTVDHINAAITGESNPVSGSLPFTPITKRALEGALREALQLGHNYISTEHLLLGLSRVGGLAQEILRELGGADHPKLRRAVLALIEESGITAKHSVLPPWLGHTTARQHRAEARRLLDAATGQDDLLRAIAHALLALSQDEAYEVRAV